MSPLLPWLAILALLALKPNRGWSAWWIWLPLAGLAAGCHYLGVALQDSPTDRSGGMLEILWDVPAALAFGVATLWLLAPCFGRGHRFRTFLSILAVLPAFVVFGFAATAGWGLGLEPLVSLLDPRHCAATASVGVMTLPFLVLPVLLALVVAVAIFLCGLACRWRHRPGWLYLWLFLSVPAACVAVLVLLHLLCWIAWPGSADYDPFIGNKSLVMAVTFATMLPFLVLSSASPFFRERLKSLLHMKPEAPPAIDPLSPA